MSRPSDDAKIEEFVIPGSPAELSEILKEAKMENVSLYNLRPQWMGSGSKVSEKQFAAFRAVWPRMKYAERLRRDIHLYGLDKFWRQAECIVSNMDDFKKFTDMLDLKLNLKDLDLDDRRRPSTLTTLKDLHEMIGYGTHEPRKSNRLKRTYQATQADPSSGAGTIKKARTVARAVLHPRASEDRAERASVEHEASPASKQLEAPDEATVNAAMIIFLRSFSSLVKDSKFEFLFERLSLTPHFGKCSFTAYTDGVFRSSDQILIIIEVKKAARLKDLQSIQMQETAEAVGWMKAFQLSAKFMKKHLLIISQDHNELYVTFASCHDDYLHYLKDENANITKNTYLSLQTYGPFSTSSKENMTSFAELVVAITLAANSI